MSTSSARTTPPTALSRPAAAPVTRVSFVDLGAQDEEIRASLRAAAFEVLDAGNYILGGHVNEFEVEFAAYCGATYGIGVASGLAALELILRGYEIGPGDEVVVPAHTFVATAGAVALVGATPVCADVGPDHLLDADALDRAIGPATRAVIGVHLYGRPFDADALRAVTQRHGIPLIEDAAQAHGATFRGRRVGTLADAAAFSFYPTKNLGASGDAGMVVTEDPELADRIRALRNCGQFVKNEHTLLPCNHRLDTIHAAMLRVRLPRLEAWNRARRATADRYRLALAGLPVALPPEDDHGRSSVYHLFVIECNRRDELAAFLNERGIGTGIHYPIPVHLQPVFRDLGYCKGDFPVAEAHVASILSLPMHPSLTAAEVDYVADAVRAFFDAP